MRERARRHSCRGLQWGQSTPPQGRWWRELSGGDVNFHAGLKVKWNLPGNMRDDLKIPSKADWIHTAPTHPTPFCKWPYSSTREEDQCQALACFFLWYPLEEISTCGIHPCAPRNYFDNLLAGNKSLNTLNNECHPLYSHTHKSKFSRFFFSSLLFCSHIYINGWP